VFSFAKGGPSGLCPEAFHALYPYAFALIYAPDKNEQRVHCPRAEGGVMFKAYRRPARFFRRILNVFKEAAQFLLPLDIIRYRIFVEVTAAGACPFGMKPGDVFEMNLGQTKDEACPAAFYQVFPGIFPAVLAGKNSAVSFSALQCPDHVVNVELKLRESGAEQNAANAATGTQDNQLVDCLAGDDIQLMVAECSPACPRQYQSGQSFRLREVLDALQLSCASAWHSLFPYYLALEWGGKLPGFYSRDKYAAWAQCPSPASKVELFIRRAKRDATMFLTTMNRKLPCPQRVTDRKDSVLPAAQEVSVCLEALSAAVPYINVLKSSDHAQSLTVACPGCQAGRTVFKLEKVCSS